MTYLVILAVIAVIIIIMYILAIGGRRNGAGWEALEGVNYAHRGLHDEKKPENSMAAFRAAMEQGYGVELDVHLLKDGQLAVFHDSTLIRVAGAEGRIEDLTAQQLGNYRLCGTEETIPAFRQVLDLFDGKVPLIVELKCVDGNYAPLCQAACDLLERYSGPYCLESFDPRCILWLRKHRPHLLRGQLTENYFRIQASLPMILKFLLTHQLINFLTRPDFVAYRFSDRKNLSNFLVAKLWGVRRVTWTLRKPEDHATAVTEGWIPIFEHYTP